METDYEELPALPTTRKLKTTYGKKSKHRSNSNSNRLLLAQRDQENEGSHTNRRLGLFSSQAESQLGKRRRSKEEEKIGKKGSESEGDASDEESEDDRVHSSNIVPLSKRPRASSQPDLLNPSSTTLLQSSSSLNPKAKSCSQTLDSSIPPLDERFPTGKSTSQPFTSSTKKTQSRSVDHSSRQEKMGDENNLMIEVVIPSQKKKTTKSDQLEEKEKDLEDMMKYIVMDDDQPMEEEGVGSQVTRPSQVPSLPQPVFTFPSRSSSTTLILGDKSNLPRLAQNEPLPPLISSSSNIQTIHQSQKKTSTGTGIKSIATSTPSKKSNLKVFRDDDEATPKASSKSIKRGASLNTSEKKKGKEVTSLDLASLSNALLSTTTELVRQSSLPIFPIDNQKEAKKIECRVQGRELTSIIEPIPISNNEMDSSMIIEDFDFDELSTQQEHDEDQDDIVMVEEVDSGRTGKEAEVEEVEVAMRKPESGAPELTIFNQGMDNYGGGAREEVAMVEEAREENKTEVKDPTLSLVLNPSPNFSPKSSDHVLPPLQVPSPHSSSSASNLDSNDSNSTNLTFTLPPRTLSKPPDSPTFNNLPKKGEDVLNYLIRTSSTSSASSSSSSYSSSSDFEKKDDHDDDDERDRKRAEKEIGRGFKVGKKLVGTLAEGERGIEVEGGKRQRRRKAKIERIRKQLLDEPLVGEEGDVEDELML